METPPRDRSGIRRGWCEEPTAREFLAGARIAETHFNSPVQIPDAEGAERQAAVNNRIRCAGRRLRPGGGPIRGRIQQAEPGAVRKSRSRERSGHIILPDREESGIVVQTSPLTGGRSVRQAVNDSGNQEVQLLPAGRPSARKGKFGEKAGTGHGAFHADGPLQGQLIRRPGPAVLEVEDGIARRQIGAGLHLVTPPPDGLIVDTGFRHRPIGLTDVYGNRGRAGKQSKPDFPLGRAGRKQNK